MRIHLRGSSVSIWSPGKGSGSVQAAAVVLSLRPCNVSVSVQQSCFRHPSDKPVSSILRLIAETFKGTLCLTWGPLPEEQRGSSESGSIFVDGYDLLSAESADMRHRRFALSFDHLLHGTAKKAWTQSLRIYTLPAFYLKGGHCVACSPQFDI